MKYWIRELLKNEILKNMLASSQISQLEGGRPAFSIIE